ncbi:hypothetical protein Taro_023648 [Colocasia esculenta]|uniref:Uncharacterized protein n=1 Tax=Colocasia esculenta TaxID=4460 RepID=A0A843VBE5_COLES|nr:hypothetical protein [Colocasia esculenta]
MRARLTCSSSSDSELEESELVGSSLSQAVAIAFFLSSCLHVCTTRTGTFSTSTTGSRSSCLHVCTTRIDALSTTGSSGSVSFATHKARLEAQLKRPPQFQELFDQTHKKERTYGYIIEKAREVAESYSRGLDERYGDDSQCPELDPDIWVVASEAPKKGHVYGFGHSLGTARVISSCSSSISHATSLFTTPIAWARSLNWTPDLD